MSSSATLILNAKISLLHASLKGMVEIKEMEKKNELIFALHSNIKLGGGTEKVIFQLILNSPQDLLNIILVQTDLVDKQRLSDDYLRKLLSKTRIVTLKSLRGKFQFLRRNIFGKLLDSLILQVVLVPFQKRVYKYFLNCINGEVVIFLTRNSDYKYFSGNDRVLVGSSHTMSKIEFRLAMNRFIYRDIDYFQVFPGMTERSGSTVRSKRDLISLPNGVDTDLFHPLSTRIPVTRLRCLFVGRLEKYKGLNTLLKTWSLMPSNLEIELHVVGGGPLENTIISSRGNLVYHGILPEEELAKVYRESDIFLYPTLIDNYPLVILEAISSGLYVITSNILKGVFDDFQERGFLEYTDIDADILSSRIMEATKNIVKIRELKQQMHQYVMEKYDWKKISLDFFDKISKLYHNRSSDVVL